MKYSFILPVHNGGAYIKECVKSILNQSLQDFNLIILENQSADGTFEWLKSLEDKRIIIHPSETLLPIDKNWARIKDIQKNEFMTCTGHDDLFDPGYLTAIDKLIQKHPSASLYQTHFRYIGSNGELVRNCKPMDEIQSAAEFISSHCKQSLDSTGTGYMMRSADYNKAGGIPTDYPGFIFADYELWISLILPAYKATTAETCFSYRINQSASYFMDSEKYQASFFHYLDYLKKILQQDKDCQNAFNKDGIEMFYYYCRSLAHRLLKSSPGKRKTRISEFVEKCKAYAKVMIPGQAFNPLLKPAILAAVILDNKIGIKLFHFYKKMS